MPEAKKTTKLELQNHDGVSVVRNEAVLLMKQSNKNEVSLGATCVSKKINEGSPMLDKETKSPRVNPTTGEVMCYPNRYYVNLTFDGGLLEIEIDKEHYSKLNEGTRYLCGGRIAPIKKFINGAFVEVISPVFNSFTELY